MFEDYDENTPEEPEEELRPTELLDEGTVAEEGSNRRFLFIIIGAVALILVAIICLVAYVLMNRNGGATRAQRETEIAQAYAQQTQIAFAQLATEQAAAFTQPPTVTPSPQPTATSRPATNTPVVAIATNTQLAGEAPTMDARMVTLTALYAQLTQSALTPLAPTTTAFATALPDTGFFDNFGMPQLFGMAALALVVIFLVRRLRTATS